MMKYYAIAINGQEQGLVRAATADAAALMGIEQWTRFGPMVASYRPVSKHTYSCQNTQGRELATVTVKLPRDQATAHLAYTSTLTKALADTYRT